MLLAVWDFSGVQRHMQRQQHMLFAGPFTDRHSKTTASVETQAGAEWTAV